LASSRRAFIRNWARRVQRTSVEEVRHLGHVALVLSRLALPVLFPAALPGRSSVSRGAHRVRPPSSLGRRTRLDARRNTGANGQIVRQLAMGRQAGLQSRHMRRADPVPRRCCGQCLLLRERVALEPSFGRSLACCVERSRLSILHSAPLYHSSGPLLTPSSFGRPLVRDNRTSSILNSLVRRWMRRDPHHKFGRRFGLSCATCILT